MLTNKRQRNSGKNRNQFVFEPLEPKRCLASVGWDGAGQGGAELNYYLGDAPANVDQATFESVIEDALEVWSNVVDITFTETATPRQADSLDITFASIDGSGGVLARAYFPDDVNRGSIAGDIQFDTSENWEVGNAQGFRAFDLMHVAVHEIGHALGLEHSDVGGSVLSSTVSPNQAFNGLDNADRDAALALYAPVVQVSIPTDPVGPVETPTVPDVETPASPVDDASNDDPTTQRDPNERRQRFWNRFNRFFQRRFRFFQVPNDSFNSGSDSGDTTQTEFGSQSKRFTIRIFRVFR